MPSESCAREWPSNEGDWAGRWSPSGTTVGVAKNSANPRAEFNIIMSQAQSTAIQGERTRYCGNFFNVFADGMNQYFPDPQRYPGTPAGNLSRAHVGLHRREPRRS